MRTTLKHFIRDQPQLRRAALRAKALVRSLDRAPPGLYTLCYHHVAAGARASFAQQLATFARAGRFVGADAAADRLAAGRPFDERAFLVTFDDGYADNLDEALPVLKDFAVPATLFLVSDWLDRPPTSRGRADGYMSRTDVDAWLAAGLHIGSHSASHSRFSTLSDTAAEAEMQRSAETLAALAGQPVRHFACPWGVAGADYDPAREPAMATAAGYRTFFTTRRGRATSAGELMRMPRHVLEPEWARYEIDALLGGARHGGR